MHDEEENEAAKLLPAATEVLSDFEEPRQAPLGSRRW
jgi:hypothetical protein